MNLKNIIYFAVLGAVLGYFIIHPLFMVIGHTMLETGFTHKYDLFDSIIHGFLDSFSRKMLPWSLSFSVVSALFFGLVGYILQMQKKLQYLSYTDPLTGVSNRRAFNEKIDQLWKHGARKSEPISLIMCDIDNFKLYNDTKGHQKGDESLKLIASTIDESLNRPFDMVARYGGEEFVIVLPDTTSNGASYIAELIREKVESLNIIYDRSSGKKILTISLGVATITPNQNPNYDILIAEADKALYRAKHLGKNRVEIAS